MLAGPRLQGLQISVGTSVFVKAASGRCFMVWCVEPWPGWFG